MHVVVVGAGNLGSALARGWLEHGVLGREELEVLVRSESYRERAPDLQDIVTYDPSSLGRAEVVVVAVKPKDLPEALPRIRPYVAREEALVVSVAAGVTLDSLRRALPRCRLARAMPNICVAVGRAETAVTFPADLDVAGREVVVGLFRGLGHVFEAEEEYFDAITALSGSGPAYVYLILEALTRAGEELGLPKELARSLAARTFEGAASMALRHGDLPLSLLIRQVASPGGTTEAALTRMRELALEDAIREGVLHANLRAASLRLKG